MFQSFYVKRPKMPAVLVASFGLVCVALDGVGSITLENASNALLTVLVLITVVGPMARATKDEVA